MKTIKLLLALLALVLIGKAYNYSEKQDKPLPEFVYHNQQEVK